MRVVLVIGIACLVGGFGCSNKQSPAQNQGEPLPSKIVEAPSTEAALPRAASKALVGGRIVRLMNELTVAEETSLWPFIVSDYDFSPDQSLRGASLDARFREIVMYGASALPVLLSLLDDDGVTTWSSGFNWDLVVRHDVLLHSYHDYETSRVARLRPTEVRERIPLEHLEDNGKSLMMRGYGYRLRVGDIAFAAIGAITNRFYWPITAQPSGGIGVTSPILHPWLVDYLRELWSVDDVVKTHEERLMQDFLDDRSWLMTGASVRLLQWCPDFDRALLVERLKRVADSEDFLAPEVIRLFTSHHETQLEDAILDIMRSTLNSDIALACLPVMERRNPAAFEQLVAGFVQKSTRSAASAPSGFKAIMRRDSILEIADKSELPSIRKLLGKD